MEIHIVSLKILNFQIVNCICLDVGSKLKPFHFLVQHGSIAVNIPDSDISYNQMKDWFMKDDVSNNIEGLVWHFSDGSLFKVFFLDFLFFF